MTRPYATSPSSSPSGAGCSHVPACPTADAPDHEAAAVVSSHYEQGWALLCNGVVVFEDTGELLPSGQPVGPHGRVPLVAA